ncbi:dihydroorotase [Chelatococcus composti]|jgi:dihydroorotase|uniref:Dihydroorotase n=1 Tax=Chelatococcus composti TaxID=1743235 RepID=A0A841K6I7_9HYPH|nr:dihydroorotase [Chelatococcus composti]MBB6168428.1 dihydroorotase [Chelatococcus composti]MBS7736492.1 dihydroorotase [Chelatococcus composti]GGG40009.1 dihydroorotase [Chelatococcus composti]
MTETITIRRPDDWHVHLRDGAMLKAVLPFTAAQFSRAIIMPNLVPPVTTTAMADAYRERIMAALPAGSRFQPLMTLYMTDDTDPADVVSGYESGRIVAVKLYPQHATTNSHFGVTDIEKIHPVLAAMEKAGVPLLIHGEVTRPEVDIFDREAVFIETVLDPLVRRFPGLKVTLEHVTTKEGVEYVTGARERVAATITPHHLIFNRNAIFQGGIRPHYYCLPIAKREEHRLALRKAATSGNPRFFLGTDTAPHARAAKEAACGCAGLFVAPVALACYAQVFEEEGALDKFEAFASLNGPRHYGLPVNEGTITLVRRPRAVAEDVSLPAGEAVHVFRGGETVSWTVADADSAAAAVA